VERYPYQGGKESRPGPFILPALPGSGKPVLESPEPLPAYFPTAGFIVRYSWGPSGIDLLGTMKRVVREAPRPDEVNGGIRDPMRNEYRS
jgi:hypothetical protein